MKLIQHLPPRLAEIKEIADIQEAIEPEIRKVEEDINQTLINKNPLNANLEGVILWEEWLHITPDPNKTLEQRQLDIVSKVNERLPFTLVQLHRILAGVVGWENLEITTYPGIPKLDITFNVSRRDAGDSVIDLLKRIIPAHVLWSLESVYNTEPSVLHQASAGMVTEIFETPLYIDNSWQIAKSGIGVGLSTMDEIEIKINSEEPKRLNTANVKAFNGSIIFEEIEVR